MRHVFIVALIVACAAGDITTPKSQITTKTILPSTTLVPTSVKTTITTHPPIQTSTLGRLLSSSSIKPDLTSSTSAPAPPPSTAAPPRPSTLPASIPSSTPVSVSSSVAVSVAASTAPSTEAITWPPSPPPPIHLPTLLEERLDTLACDISLPPNAKIWRANQTEELLLPIEGEVPEDDDAWSGTATVQTGDVLLVKIDDAPLVNAARGHMSSRANSPLEQTADASGIHRHRQPEFSVYQVTRLGYERCDATEGVLLDITPLQIEDRQVVTLYDKDLTEGINLLIVVSTRWLEERCVRLRVVVKADNCGDGQDCSAKGVCFTNGSMEGFECQCCAGFVGAHCEEQDACFPSPCQNHGICVDISQGHDGSTFQCLCPYGFTGKTCELEADPCDSSPCQNGGTCAGNATHFRCSCVAGFVGDQCQHNLDECASAPCVHGICVDQEDGYRCFCQPGFAGEHCEYEYNECESSPCINGGTCTDHIGSYSCICGRGYTGKRCHVKIDLCDPNPCPDHRYCIDRGNNYSCECPKGFSGPSCQVPARAACSGKPCHNGGTCWSSADTFYCACRPGFTGTTCEERFVLEAIPTQHAHQDGFAGGLAPHGVEGGEGGLDLQMPISIHLDHLHSVYIAAGTLACALIIVLVTVAACHCRLHETYKRCFVKPSSILPFRSRRLHEDPLPKDSGCHASSPLQPVKTEKSRPLPSSRSFPALDTSDMYYTLDFSDSQSSPLIQ